MIEEKGQIDQPNPTLKQKSMLSKYEIPLDHLNYEYIGACKDVKELERIIQILRSKEEGYYPDLEKKAKERLRSLSPNNQQLLSEEPAITWKSIYNNSWVNTRYDLTNWNRDVSVKDLKLSEENNNNNTMEDISGPAVRQSILAMSAPENITIKNGFRTKRGGSDNPTWEKYDADSELLKMDLDEEIHEQQKETQRKEIEKEELKEKEKEEQKKERRQVETNRLIALIKEAERLPDTERQILADQEKERGNEYFKAKEYNEAIEYYTASINIWPTPNAHNNRAACYLKQCRYSAALDDATSTLALDPDNVKALFRRGIALQHKNLFREALADMNAVLRQQPKHVLAQHISKELREQILNLPRTIRVMRDEGFNKTKKVVELKSEAMPKGQIGYRSFEVNEWNLPKVMCECSGSPRFLQFAPKKTHLPHLQPQASSMVSDARIIEVTNDAEMLKPSTKLEIMEIEKSEASEDFFRQKKCVVVSERTLLKPSPCANENDSQTSSSNYESFTNSSSADSTGYFTVDEDFELNSLLDDASDEADV